jgi:hypothetical protein
MFSVSEKRHGYSTWVSGMVQGYYGVVYGFQITRVSGRMAVREDLTVIVWTAWLPEYKVLRCTIAILLGTLLGCRYVQEYYGV